MVRVSVTQGSANGCLGNLRFHGRARTASGLAPIGRHMTARESWTRQRAPPSIAGPSAIPWKLVKRLRRILVSVRRGNLNFEKSVFG
jgi:hypothetical protein